MSAERELITYPTPRLMAVAVAERMLLELNDLLCAGAPRADIAVTGGTDGTAILKAIAASELVDVVDWSRVHVWWGDERFVARDNPERNALQARTALFDGLVQSGLMAESQIHEMPADPRTPQEIEAAGDDSNAIILADAATMYQEELESELGDQPTMDIAMFGLGPDGHFASLFPGRRELRIVDPDVLVAGVTDSPKQPPLRLTFTIPMIARSGQTWICASREKKANATSHTYINLDDADWPASFAQSVCHTLWITDRSAASLI